MYEQGEARNTRYEHGVFGDNDGTVAIAKTAEGTVAIAKTAEGNCHPEGACD